MGSRAKIKVEKLKEPIFEVFEYLERIKFNG